MENANYMACRCVSLLVDAMEQQAMDDEQVADQNVEHVVELGPEMVTKPVIKETERRIVLEQAVTTIARNVLDTTPIAGWRRVVLKHRWNAFRRALCGAPLEKVELLRVILELDVRPDKERPCIYSPTKAAW